MMSETAAEIELSKNPKFISCFAWAILLTWLAVLPHTFFRLFFGPRITHAFSLGHFICYGILSYLLCPYLRSTRKILAYEINLKNSILIAFGITFFWGALTEVLQFTSADRIPDMWDIILDCLGAIMGVAIYSILSRLQIRSQQKLSQSEEFSGIALSDQ